MVYKWYILPIGGLHATYHLLGEPETTIDPVGDDGILGWGTTQGICYQRQEGRIIRFEGLSKHHLLLSKQKCPYLRLWALGFASASEGKKNLIENIFRWRMVVIVTGCKLDY